jgi:uncharacterized membrane protein YdcZ (DUF606 family)
MVVPFFYPSSPPAEPLTILTQGCVNTITSADVDVPRVGTVLGSEVFVRGQIVSAMLIDFGQWRYVKLGAVGHAGCSSRYIITFSAN